MQRPPQTNQVPGASCPSPACGPEARRSHPESSQRCVGVPALGGTTTPGSLRGEVVPVSRDALPATVAAVVPAGVAWRRGGVGWRKTSPWRPWWPGGLLANAPLPTGRRPAGSDPTPALRRLEGRLMATPALAAQPGPGCRTRTRKSTDWGSEGGGLFFLRSILRAAR